MDASIPGRYGFRRRSEQRTVALERAWASCRAVVSAELEGDPAASSSAVPPLVLPWDELPVGLDPAEGELDEGRTARKRDQVASLVAHALAMVEHVPSVRIVEFGSGSGHLGVLLAHLRPDARVVLVEMKAFGCDLARKRVDGVGLSNCEVFNGTVDDYAATEEAFDLAVGLHTCGLLTDAVLSFAISRGAAVCVVPCCYGQVAAFKEDHNRGQGVAARRRPLSKKMGTIMFDDGFCGECDDTYAWCAKAADFTAKKGGEFDPSLPGFQTALRCMRTLDTDRLWWAREQGYTGSLSILTPLGCSPKCCVVQLRPLEGGLQE